MEVEEWQDIVKDRLIELERCVSGQRIDEVKSNYDLRAEMAKNRMLHLKAEYCTIIDAVCVKLITQEVSFELYWKYQNESSLVTTDLKGCVVTYRVKRSTSFKDIYDAACSHWDLNKRKYLLTDEYFNDLSIYNESVSNFFRGYQPMNSRNEAIVYIVEDDRKTKESKSVLKESGMNRRRGLNNDPATMK
mmetsp:Transcript_4851/g.4604  ORF Transcript_4851/g.4604 Transcript_4851/m.4604 type:complete len:190 (-) Transcript_4851:1729-2298(-)